MTIGDVPQKELEDLHNWFISAFIIKVVIQVSYQLLIVLNNFWECNKKE